MRSFILGTVALGFLAAAGAVSAGDFELYLWRQELAGTISGNLLGVTSAGTARVDESDEWGLRGSVKVGGAEFDVGYVTLSNATQLDGAFTFDGTPFLGGANLDLDAKVYEFFPKVTLGETSGNSFKFIVGLKVMDVTASVSDGLLVGTLDELIPIPQIGVRLVTRLGRNARFDFTYKWLDLKIRSVDVKAIDFQADLALRLQPGGDLVLGWRRYDYDVTADEGTSQQARVNLEHSGPYVGWRMTF